MMINDGRETLDQSKIANGFINFFLNIRSKLRSSIPSLFEDFKDFLGATEINLDEFLL